MENSAEILPYTSENVKLLAQDIRDGKVVSFPTETVYGLGANALDEQAVLKIFEYKGRPLSDPVIVHVDSADKAIALFDLAEGEEELIRFAEKHFWPGPLTMIFKAKSSVSPKLTANTGFLAVRIPNNPVALELIKESGCPIGAPSANKFCHVSPVSAEHVLADFKELPVKIIDGGLCTFRMESTVVKFDVASKSFKISRKGSLSLKKILETFESSPDFKGWTGEYATKTIKKETESVDTPGNFVKHYSPYLETYVYDPQAEESISKAELDKIVFLDFNNHFKAKFPEAKIIQLSTADYGKEAMENFYFSLRASESADLKYCILPNLKELLDSSSEEYETLIDRVSRASSGRAVRIE